jgi:hypothetical protein
MTEPDAVMTRIGRAVELGQHGDREAARRLLTALDEGIGPDGDPLYRVAVAHAMADLQDDPRDELAWDQRALQAAGTVTDERVALAGMAGPVSGLYPSLHLNLGEDYRKLGDLAAARRHLELGRAAARNLGDDGYSSMIRAGLDRLAGRLA